VTSLFMGFISNAGVPADEKVVRNTATPVVPDKPAAMQDDMPMMGEYDTDSDPNLGMDPRQLASKWSEGQRSTPAWIPEVAETTQSTTIINEQVSTSGTAASREQAGVTNKNLSYAVGIEPVGDLREGGKMGNDYFVRNEREVQATMDASMTMPMGYDQRTTMLVENQGKTNARDAQAAAYNAFWNGGN
jgi:hypothetical protein